jgi:hypothetical protein
MRAGRLHLTRILLLYGYSETAYRQVYSPSYLKKDRKVRAGIKLCATATLEGELV